MSPIRSAGSAVTPGGGGGGAATFDTLVVDIREFLDPGFASGDDATTAFDNALAQAAVDGLEVWVTPRFLYGVSSVAMPTGTTIRNADGVSYVYSGGLTNKECFSFNEFGASTYVEDVAFYGGVFDFTTIGGGLTGLHCIRVWGAKRWKIHDVSAIQSDYGTIAHVSRGSGTYNLIAQQGEISNLRFTGATNSNYGCVQVNGVLGLTAWNLYGEQGINMRLENDGQNYDVADVYVFNNRMITGNSASRPAAITVHNNEMRNIVFDGIYAEGTSGTIAAVAIWNETGTLPIRNVTIRNVECVNATLWSPGQTLGNLTRRIKVEGVTIRGITDASKIALGLTDGVYRDVLVEDNACQAVEKLWGTDAADQQEILLENAVIRRNGGTAHIRQDVSTKRITLRNVRAYDDRHTNGATLGSELVTNTGFETDTSGWVNASNCTIARSTSIFNTGAASLEITVTAGGTNATASTTVGTGGFAVTPTNVLAVGANVRTNGQSRRIRLELRFYDSGGATLSTVTGNYRMANGARFIPLSNGIAVPASAAYCAVRVTVNGTGSQSGEKVYVDDVTCKTTDKAAQALIYGVWGSSTKVAEMVVDSCDIEYGPTFDFYNSQPTNLRVINPRNLAVANMASSDFQPTAGTETLAGYHRVRIGNTEYRIPLYNA